MTTPHGPRRYWEPRTNPEEEPVRRRNFITAAVAATGAGLLPGVLAEAAVAAPDRLRGSTTIATAITDLEADVWNTGAAYVAPGSAPARDDLMQVAQWQWAQAVVAANRTARSPLHRRALSVESEAARQLAMICADRSDPANAIRLYRQSVGAAERAGNPELLAWVCTSRAYMTLYNCEYQRTIKTAHAALAALETATRPGGRAAACAHALLARSYAATGDAARTDTALRAAYGAQSRYKDAGSPAYPAPHHPQRFAWVKLHLAAAEACAALGDRDAHQRAYDTALADPSVSAMHRPMLRLGLAEVDPDPDFAGTEALAVLRESDRPANPIVGRARALAARAAAKDPRNETVQELRLLLLKLPR